MWQGDSIARRAGVAARSGDQALNRAWRGATWTELHDRVGREIAAWQMAAAASDLALGRIVIWLTGNDVHNNESYLASFDREKLLRIGLIAREVVLEAMLHGDVCILGPLPRLAGHAAEVTWESTASYHLERTLLKAGLGQISSFSLLGRALARKKGEEAARANRL